MELARLRALAPAVRRRVLRASARQLGCALNFEQTERLMAMCDGDRDASRKQQLATELWAERTARELRLVRAPVIDTVVADEPIEVAIPGCVTAMGVTLRIQMRGGEEEKRIAPAILRAPRAGDRARLRHSRGAKPLKEIFERIGVAAEERRAWPLLDWDGRIVWMKDVALETEVPFVVEIVGGANGM